MTAGLCPELRSCILDDLGALAGVRASRYVADIQFPNFAKRDLFMELAQLGAMMIAFNQMTERDRIEGAHAAAEDCAAKGPNPENCHFRHFATPEQMQAWERGKTETA